MVNAIGKDGYGKGSSYRKYDENLWKEFWKRYCKARGHKFNQNGICIYCEAKKEETSIE